MTNQNDKHSKGRIQSGGKISREKDESAELKAAEKSLAKDARHFSGLSSACQPKFFVKTFG